jgi:hypothetical protein
VTNVSSAPATKADIKEAVDELRLEFERFATKEDLERFATKEDLERFATKEDLERFATKEDLEQYATKEDLARHPTHEDLARALEPYATKQDLETWGGALHDELRRLVGSILERQEDHMNVLLEHLAGRSDAIQRDVAAVRNDLDAHRTDRAVHREPRRRRT